MTITVGSNVQYAALPQDGRNGLMGRVTRVVGVHSFYSTPETVDVKLTTGETVSGVHVDNLTELPTVVTNNVPRFVVDAYELTSAERAEFDYLDWTAIDAGTDSASFVRYRGDLTPLSDFSASWGLARDGGLPAWLTGWDGYLSDSAFSGLLIRYADSECESVVIARFYS